jgi:PilZ domain
VHRRKSLRFRLQLPVVARWTDDEGQVRYGAGFSRDICDRGVFIISSERPPIGAMVSINVHLPYLRADLQEWHLQSVGSVVRVEQAADSAGYAVHCDFRGLEDIAQ